MAGTTTRRAALPADAFTPALSAIDKRVLDLWRRRAKLLAIVTRIVERREPEKAILNKRWDAANAAIGAVDAMIEERIEGSILALAAFILRIIEDDQQYGIVVEDTPWLPHVILKGIRPHLAGDIAADVERVLAQGEEREAT